MENAPDNIEERLLQNGCVVMYCNPFLMESHGSQLVAAGWEFREVYEADKGTWEEFSESIACSLEFPIWNGRNLNALRDCLSDVTPGATGKLALGLMRYDLFARNEPEKAQVVLDILAEMERTWLLRNERILFLVQSDDPDLHFDAVGAQPVLWNFEEWLDSHRKSKGS